MYGTWVEHDEFADILDFSSHYDGRWAAELLYTL